MATSNTWYPRIENLIPPWVIPVPIYSDELFSSWLARASLTQGCDPLVLASETLGKWRILTIDADRLYNDERLLVLAQVSGNSIATFNQSSLFPIAQKIYGNTPPEAIWPWILALGSRNRKRSGGLQYCPQCLVSDVKPYFRQKWRFAWHTVCEHHQTLLLDRCSTCHAPIEPQRLDAEDKRLNVCATCKSDISNVTPAMASQEAINFQLLVDSVLFYGYGHFHGKTISSIEWFKLMDFFCAMIRRFNRSHSVLLEEFLLRLSVIESNHLPVFSGAGVELLRTQERYALFIHTFRLLKSSYKLVESALLSSGMTRQAFCEHVEYLPNALSTLYDLLPNNPKKRGKRILRKKFEPRPKHEVIRMMAKLKRKLDMLQR